MAGRLTLHEIRAGLEGAARRRPNSIDGRVSAGGHVLAEPDGSPSGIVGATLVALGIPLPGWDDRANRSGGSLSMVNSVRAWIESCGATADSDAIELLRRAADLARCGVAGAPMPWGQVAETLRSQTPEQWDEENRQEELARRGSELAEALSWLPRGWCTA